MAYNPPIPDSGRNPRKPTPGLHSLVQAERLMQSAIVLPCAALIGWGAGWCVDHLHAYRLGALLSA